MRSMAKTFLAALICLVSYVAVWPMPKADAAPVTQFQDSPVNGDAIIAPDLYRTVPPLVIPEPTSPDDSKAPIRLNPGVTDHVDISEYLEKFNITPEQAEGTTVSGVALDQTSMTLPTGDSRSLVPTVTPADAANRSVVWSSDNPLIAEVDSAGQVTGKSPGTAKITVQTVAGNFTAVCIVTVAANEQPVPPANPAAGFPDLAGHPANAEIVKAVELGVVLGYEDGMFRPDGGVTRAEFATMLMRALNPPNEGAPLGFHDLNSIGDWAVTPVRQAVSLGIVNGYDDGTFRPHAGITHAEMIAMVIRASGLPTEEMGKTDFADDAEIPGWAKPSASKAQETGIIIVGGLPEARFAPQAPTTRAEAASAIVRMMTLRQ